VQYSTVPGYGTYAAKASEQKIPLYELYISSTIEEGNLTLPRTVPPVGRDDARAPAAQPPGKRAAISKNAPPRRLAFAEKLLRALYILRWSVWTLLLVVASAENLPSGSLRDESRSGPGQRARGAKAGLSAHSCEVFIGPSLPCVSSARRW
jgi:hypothetical protein